MWFAKKKIIEVKYCRIKKPKKDELIIFQFVGDPHRDEVSRFFERLEMARNKKGGYLVISGVDLKINHVKRKQIKKGMI